jgi:hypothetical protein
MIGKGNLDTAYGPAPDHFQKKSLILRISEASCYNDLSQLLLQSQFL